MRMLRRGDPPWSSLHGEGQDWVRVRDKVRVRVRYGELWVFAFLLCVFFFLLSASRPSSFFLSFFLQWLDVFKYYKRYPSYSSSSSSFFFFLTSFIKPTTPKTLKLKQHKEEKKKLLR